MNDLTWNRKCCIEFCEWQQKNGSVYLRLHQKFCFAFITEHRRKIYLFFLINKWLDHYDTHHFYILSAPSLFQKLSGPNRFFKIEIFIFGMLPELSGLSGPVQIISGTVFNYTFSHNFHPILSKHETTFF